MLRQLFRHPIPVVQMALKRILDIPSKGLPTPFRRTADDFDEKYGVETSGIVQIVRTDSLNFTHGTRYQPSGEEEISWSIENCGMVLPETTFVDLGCGKGRALIVAARYRFRRIIGVEYSSDLIEICRRNLHKVGAAERCELILGDAADFHPPAGNILVFLFNPFDSIVLTCVLNNLASVSGLVRVAQLGPGHEVIRRSRIAREICNGRGPTLYEIAARDVRGSGLISENTP